MYDLRFDGRLTHGCGWALGLNLWQKELARNAIRGPLHFVTPINHHGFSELDGGRISCIQIEHRRRSTRAKFFLPFLAQQIAHGHRHIAEVNIDRTGVLTLMANRAVIRDVGELVEMTQ